MAQSNEQGDDDLRRVANRIRDSYSLLEAEKILSDWLEPYLKQHELEARIDELGRITGLFTSRSTGGENIPAMKRLAELKAEREAL